MIRSLTATASLIALFTSSAYARAAEDPQAAQAAPAGAESGLEEIVVTAQRRTENLQKAAIAVSAVSGDSLKSAGIIDVKQLASVVPALQISGANGPYANFYLRGVGNVNANSFSESAIAFNYDGVYIGRPSSTFGFFYDLERIEVLKGPQGTLYGRNATGGAINVITRKPGKELEFTASAEYGNHDALRLDAAVNVPVGEKVAVRAAGIYVRHDGYMKDGTDDQKDYGGRFLAKLDPTEDVSILLNFDVFHQGGKGAGVTSPELGKNNRFGLSSAEGQAQYSTLFNVLGGRNFIGVPATQFRNNDYYGISATMNWTTDIGTFTLIPAYRHSKLASDNSVLGFSIYQTEVSTQKSVEARFASDDSKSLRVLLGGYYFKDKSHDPLFKVVQQYDLTYEPDVRTGTESSALFGRATYAVSDAFRLNAGVRYTHETKNFNGTLYNSQIICLQQTGCPTATPFPYGPGPRPTQVYDSTGHAITQDNGDGTILIGTRIINNSDASFSRVTWRAGAEYDLSSRNLLYMSYETGFKSGGFFFTHDNSVYKPEKLGAFTLGSKNRFMDNRLQANLELFYWKYKDQQISHISLDSAGSIVFPTENIGSATFKGFELETQFLPMPDTLLTFDAQYLDAKYDNFVYTVPNLGGPPGSACTVLSATSIYTLSCSGRRPPQAPKWTINMGIQQTIPLANGARIVAGARAHFQSKTLTALEFLPGQYQNSYWLADANLTYNAPDDRWFVGAYANNIGNRTVRIGTYSVPFAAREYLVGLLREPRTYGVRAGVRF